MIIEGTLLSNFVYENCFMQCYHDHYSSKGRFQEVSVSYLRAIRVQYNPKEFVPRGIGHSGVVLIEFFYKCLQTKQGFVILIIRAHWHTFKGN